MKEREIPELLLKCCSKILKPLRIKFLDNYVEITFFCPICRNWVYLQSKNDYNKALSNINTIKQKKKLPYKYIKKGETNAKK